MRAEWPAAGSVDPKIGCCRKPEASDAEAFPVAASRLLPQILI
jgi:hypothetical protein